jgi:hypothetical protein
VGDGQEARLRLLLTDEDQRHHADAGSRRAPKEMGPRAVLLREGFDLDVLIELVFRFEAGLLACIHARYEEGLLELRGGSLRSFADVFVVLELFARDAPKV